jgi:hypothetical protein
MSDFLNRFKILEQESTTKFGEFLYVDKSFQTSDVTRWDEKKQSAFFASCVRNLNASPNVYVDVEQCLALAKENEDWESIDYFEPLFEAGVRYVNLDSHNRQLCLRAIHKNEVKLPYGRYQTKNRGIVTVGKKNCTYETMPRELREMFESNTQSYTIYTQATREDLSAIFLNLNSGEPLNDAEMRNAVTSERANIIRDLASKYFELLDSSKFPTNSTRRGIDAIIAMMAFRCAAQGNEKLAKPNKNQLMDFYRQYSESAGKSTQQFAKRFDQFVSLFGDNIKAMPNTSFFFDVFHIWYDYTYYRGLGKLTDTEGFIKTLLDAIYELRDDDTPDENRNRRTFSKKGDAVTFQFIQGGDKGKNLGNRLVWIQEVFTPEIASQFFKANTPRTANAVTRLGAAVRDGFKTPEGVDIPLSEVQNGQMFEGGHIIPDRDGGTADLNNIALQTKEDNRKLGARPIKYA